MYFDGFSQFLMMMYKGFLLRKRHYVVTAFEIVIPLLVACPVAIIMSLVSPDSRMNPNGMDKPDFKNATFYEPFSPFKTDAYTRNVVILYMPNNTKSVTLIKKATEIYTRRSLQTTSFTLLGYDDEAELEQSGAILQAESSSDRPIIGTVLSNFISSDSKLPASLDYKIRCGNRYGYDLFDLKSKYSYRIGPRYYSQYIQTMFLAWQASIEQAFIALKSDKSEMNGDYQVQMNRFPYPPYNPSPPGSAIIEIIDMLIAYGFVIYFCVLVKRVVVEKANHSKELLKMMGMSDCTYWNSVFWNSFLFGAILMLSITIMYTVPLENSMKVFANVGFGLLFFLLLLYLAAAILFCLAVTTFFNRPNVAVCITLLLHVISHSVLMSFYFPIEMPSTAFSDLNLASKFGICLLPNGALLIVFRFLSAFEGPGGYDGWSSIVRPTVYPDIVLGEVIIMMIVSCFVYALIIWYVDAVWPWQLGVPKPFYFPLTKSYWCGTSSEKSFSETWESQNQYFEKDPDGTTPGIVIRNLTKVFKVGHVPKKAVDNLSLNIYSGEITALLGRNGAGKTTTINILTGLFLPTKGSASINGYDIHANTKKARSSLGICPQHNVLYDTLTVEEHLKLYAGLKGVKWGDLSEEVTRILKLLNLEEKRTELSQSLSGGMKRKLSLGIAIIGGSKVLFLDEPTSGMDPEARRVLWDILLDIRGDHTIVLTTHYMEEADILGDRIAIMADGKVQCCGSPMFLKKKFGTGYHVHMSQNSNCDVNALTALLQRYCPETTLESARESLTLTYSLGGNVLGSVLGTMFQDLESKKVELGVSSFGISVTTMDDVFLKVSMLASEDLGKNVITESETICLSMESVEGQFSLQYEKVRLPQQLWVQQFLSLLMKRFCYAKRQWGVLIFQAAIPFAVICMFLATLRSTFSIATPYPLKLDLASVYGETEGIYNFKGDAVQFGNKAYLPVIEADEVKVSEVNDPREHALRMANRSLSTYLKRLSLGGVGTKSGRSLNVTAWYNGEPFHTLPMALNTMHEALLRFFTGDSSSSITLTNSPLPASSAVSMDSRNRMNIIRILGSIFVPLSLAFYSACYVLVPIHECSSRAKLLQLMSGISAFTYWLAMFVWDMLFHVLIVLLLIIPFGIFAGYVFFPHPEAIGGVIVLLLFFGWSTLPICYLLSRAIDKPASGFTLVLSFTIIAGLILSLIMNIVEMAVGTGDKDVQLALYFLRFLPSFAVARGMSNLIAISYDNSFCDSIPTNVLNIQCDLQAHGWQSDMAQCCKATCGNNCFNKTYPMTWDTFGCGRDMFFLWIDGIIFFALLLFCETGIVEKLWSAFVVKLPWKKTGVAAKVAEGLTSASVDADVLQESNRIQNLVSNIDPSEALVVRELTKWYKGFCAVDGLTFGVRKEECFGLLGVNGAGKSSTFKMLTGDTFPTKGNAFIQDASIQASLKKFQSFIGYCPQHDALIDRLTAREILRLFACLRGISRRDVNSCVTSLINRVDLQEYADKPCKFYSGGNKRKLSLAMALIGTPPLILLDEPTAGVDPVSRRKIWSVLEDARKVTKSAVILCTHSMEECEALCSRLAIMVNGQFRCLGSIQHLKSQYGLGFTVIIKLTREQGLDNQIKNGIRTNFEKTFPSANLKDDHQGMFHYHLTDTEISWSFLFKAVETMKQNFQFEDYLISGTTLEQIFLAFARGQRAEETT